jgi:hypothetical protein
LEVIEKIKALEEQPVDDLKYQNFLTFKEFKTTFEGENLEILSQLVSILTKDLDENIS